MNDFIGVYESNDDGTESFYVVGRCFACRRVFPFDPARVPSIRREGERRPLCEQCIGRANEMRLANGLPSISVLPGAYPRGGPMVQTWDRIADGLHEIDDADDVPLRPRGVKGAD